MKFPHWLNVAASAVVAAVLPACDGINMRELKPGQSTEAEVRQRMGEPTTIHWNDDGTATWEYNRQPEGIHCYMISFNTDQVMTRIEQVLNDQTYGKIMPGLSKDDVRRLLGAPAKKTVFKNLNEEVWEWRIEGMPPTEETYFLVHFDMSHGAVKKTSKLIQPRG